MLIYKQLVYLECYITTLRIQLHSNYHVTLPHHILTFSHLAICLIIIIIHRILNTFALINLSNIFYNTQKTDLKIKEEYYGKKCSENHCKHRK